MSTAERKPARPTQVGAPPPEPEHLPCPRCDSTNTKFCYYNNYNFSQPRHFCKSCRRYWTHGGTLRDIPVGGGTRKNAKRSRTAVSSAGAFRAATQILADHGGAGSFTSLLNAPGTGIWAAFGLGIDEVGFGLGSEVWPFSVEGGPGSSVGGHAPLLLENGECGFGGISYTNY